ncbi:hypothetical protein L7F22_050509 [Adiantum nelumboides]|nr:hypothetical protein [Adiantum nelumboides]
MDYYGIPALELMAKSKRKKRGKASAFYDMNVSTEGLSQAERVSLITTALQLGYSGVAFNHVVKGSLSDAHVCKSRSLDLSAIASVHPDVAQSAHFHRDILGVPPANRAFRQYDRLTVTVDTAIQASALNAGNHVLRSYDLVAIHPTIQKVFDQACTHLEVDLITLDFLHRLPIRLKPSSIQAALAQGVFFEVSFSGAFQDVRARRELFANAQILQGLTRGKNIIATSGAENMMDLRGPNDIANMATFFDLSREAAKHSVSKNCEDAIVRVLARKRTYKSAVIVERIPAWEISESGEAWFEVPKAWDPLSNTRIESEFLLPENTLNFGALANASDSCQHIEEQPGTSTRLNTIYSSVQVDSLDEGPEKVPYQDKEEGFLSIDFPPAVGGLKRERRVNVEKQGKHMGKPKKKRKK